MENKTENKLKIWLENAFNRKANSNVVFVNNSNRLLEIENCFRANIEIIDTIIIQNDKTINSNTRNYIVTTFGFSCLKNIFNSAIKNGFIFIKDDENINQFIYAIENRNPDICNQISFKLVEPVNLEELLHYEQKELYDFIKGREDILQAINNKYIKLDEEYLRCYLAVYYEKKILIASFIQKLYRLANLDFISSDKKIGGILSKMLLTSSKTFTPKQIGINCNTKKITNIKAYDLNINEVEQNVKIDIATELIKLDLKELDITKISKITKLPIKIVENIFKKICLK